MYLFPIKKIYLIYLTRTPKFLHVKAPLIMQTHRSPRRRGEALIPVPSQLAATVTVPSHNNGGFFWWKAPPHSSKLAFTTPTTFITRWSFEKDYNYKRTSMEIVLFMPITWYSYHYPFVKIKLHEMLPTKHWI